MVCSTKLHFVKKEKLNHRELNIPSAHTLPDDEDGEVMPYFFAGDEAFPLRHDLL